MAKSCRIGLVLVVVVMVLANKLNSVDCAMVWTPITASTTTTSTTTISTTTTSTTTKPTTPVTTTTSTTTTSTTPTVTTSTTTSTPNPVEGEQFQFDAFLSYRRAPSKHLAMLLKLLLEEKAIHPFLDVEDLMGGPWHPQLISAIKNSRHFILILSKTSLDRTKNDPEFVDVVHQEIREAVQLGKNIIPVFDEYDFPPATDFSSVVQTALKYQGVKWEHAQVMDSLVKLIDYMNGTPKTKGIFYEEQPSFRKLLSTELLRSNQTISGRTM